MIKYICEKDKYFKDYVVNYTNATFLVDRNSKADLQLDGLFSGYNDKTRKYDKKTWAYQMDGQGIPRKDPTLKNPNCVFQQLRKHYERYTPDKVSDITGTPKEKLLEVYQAYASTGKPDKAGTELYAMGWTQHTVGTQNIRAMTIVQLLLGNMGIAGGGINALRGESNVQGSTDQGLLFHILPGYLPTPSASLANLKAYIEKHTPKTKDPKSVNWWSNTPKYTVSLLKTWYGDKATKENDFGYAWLPKADDGKTYSWLDMCDVMYQGKINGMFVWSQNPAGSHPNINKVVKALTNLDWLVHANIFNNETASFWHGPGLDPKKIKTEVFLLPAACSVERDGSLANSGRLVQWRYKAVDPPGDAIADGEMVNRLIVKLKELYKKDGGKCPDPILNLKWDYVDDKGQFDPHKMAKQCNGYFLKDVTLKDPTGKDVTFKKGDLVPAFPFLQADGSTSCGNWLYCASYTNAGEHDGPQRQEKTRPAWGFSPTGPGAGP